MLAVALLQSVAYNAPTAPVRAFAASPRAPVVSMDETIFEKALAGELEEEGAENVFMSEVGWATYLDKNAESSYNMNQRVSLAEDGYFTPDIFSNPLDVLGSFVEGFKTTLSAPLNTHFLSISNDQTGNRAWPKGYNEIKSRTIVPKFKDFDKKLRITGIPGFNFFGTPSSKQDTGPLKLD